MATQNISGRVQVKRGLTAQWDAAVNFTPLAGEIIVYLDYKTITKNNETVYVPGIKIGSGNGYVQDLAFVGEAEANAILEHIGDNVRHITAAERTAWNNKLNVNDVQEVVDETLYFNRN